VNRVLCIWLAVSSSRMRTSPCWHRDSGALQVCDHKTGHVRGAGCQTASRTVANCPRNRKHLKSAVAVRVSDGCMARLSRASATGQLCAPCPVGQDMFSWNLIVGGPMPAPRCTPQGGRIGISRTIAGRTNPSRMWRPAIRGGHQVSGIQRQELEERVLKP